MADLEVAPEKLMTGLIYDIFMTKHRNEFNPNHPETPERMTEAWLALEMKGLTRRCLIIDSRDATEEEILRVHSEPHLSVLSSTHDLPQDKLNTLSLAYNSIFINTHSFHVARLAAGSVTQLVEEVVMGRVGNGMAIVRPPGHHAESSKCMGFSIFNNVAIAAKHAIEKLGLKRVLIVDWDIHHGNGTQHQFYDDDRVLYFSLHRYDDGGFFPCSEDAEYDQVGTGKGEGFNINVAWNFDAMGDTEYLLAFYHILLPVALEFNPELVIVSCGFDAGEGDQLGGYHVTPACYAHMTHLLMGVAQGKLVLALEGGYNLSCIRESASAIVSTLLGDTPLPEIGVTTVPRPSALKSIANTGLMLSKYWKNLQVFEGTGGAPNGGGDGNGLSQQCGAGAGAPGTVVAEAETDAPEGKGGQSNIFGRGEPTENLSELLSTLGAGKTTTTLSEEPEHGPQEATTDLETLQSHDQGASSCDQATAMDQDAITMFAVTPKPWCEHLSAHVKPLPPRGIDGSQPCEICGEKQEPWVCLSCYSIFCGRYVNEHMLIHQDTSGHKMALSLADISVWCYLCDSYIHNHVLLPAKNSVHMSKFGVSMPGT